MLMKRPGQVRNVTLVTTQLRNGDVFYMVAVRRRVRHAALVGVHNILRSVRLTD